MVTPGRFNPIAFSGSWRNTKVDISERFGAQSGQTSGLAIRYSHLEYSIPTVSTSHVGIWWKFANLTLIVTVRPTNAGALAMPTDFVDDLSKGITRGFVSRAVIKNRQPRHLASGRSIHRRRATWENPSREVRGVGGLAHGSDPRVPSGAPLAGESFVPDSRC
jgi:hypothetical protein